MSLPQKAIFFDLMGTCCDWLSSMLPYLQERPGLNPEDLSATPEIHEQKMRDFALSWRAGFFAEIQSRFDRKEEPEDIDITHRRVLDRILSDFKIDPTIWTDRIRDELVERWHHQTPWPDVLPGINILRQSGDFFLIVLANGTTRLQLDIASSSGIPFHMLMSSELLGVTKPDPEMYRRAMKLAKLGPEDCIMLASHLYDLEAAKEVGMTTVYVERSTEDVGIDFEKERKKCYVDCWVDGRSKTENKGFVRAADKLLQL